MRSTFTTSGRPRRGRAPARLRVAAFAAIVMAVAGGCRGSGGAATPATPQPVEVGPENIAVAASGTIATGPTISGSLTPEIAATVRAQVAGPVVQTYVQQGDSVRRGQLLARIDDTAIRESYLSAQAAERSAALALDNARRDAQRSDTLEKAGAISQQALETARRTLAAAVASAADAKSRLAAAASQLGYTRIRSPFTGIVSARPVNAGDVVQPGAAVVTVVNPASMRLDAAVPAEQIAAVHTGQAVEFSVNGYPGRTFTGHITRINPAADSATRQVRLYVSIPNAGRRLVAGLFAQGQVASDSHRALLAPISAVDESGLTPSVTRLHDGRAMHMAVQLGVRDVRHGQVEIRSGLAAGDTLLVGAAQTITTGTPVRVLSTTEQATTAQ